MKGIDYGHGKTNVDKETGIRYGVISAASVGQSWYDSAESDYGAAHCPECGHEAVSYPGNVVAYALSKGLIVTPEWVLGQDPAVLGYKHDENSCEDYACDKCKCLIASEDAFGQEAEAFYVGTIGDDGKLVPDSDGYIATQSGGDTDIFIMRSPYYTRARFCSPCAPGACHLENPTEDGERAYCFGHDWFEDELAPYPVYRVDNDEQVLGGIP